MDIMAIVPARSGSKGIKDKNIREVCGFPLIAYSIAIARMCRFVKRIIVSTDSEEYARVARFYGAEVPFLRPKSISLDFSQDIEYLKYTLERMKDIDGNVSDTIVLLRPTTPLRHVKDIEDAVHELDCMETTSAIVSVSLSKECPYKWVKINDDGYIESPFVELEPDDVNLPRQSFGEIYIPDGYVDVLRSREILVNGKVYGKTAKPWFNTHEMIDIDSEEDLELIDNTYLMETDLYKYMKKTYDLRGGK